MVEVLALITQRPVIIVLAITGALLVTGGGFLAKSSAASPQQRLSNAGYAITGLSILLFVIAGFLPQP